MSRGVKVRIKVDNKEVEIETEGAEHLGSIVDAVYKLLDVLMVRGVYAPNDKSLTRDLANPEEHHVAVSITDDQEYSASAELPDIEISGEENLPSLIVKMFSTEWGRKPRRLMEIKNALDSYGIIHPKQSIAVTLLRLAKTGKLRRFKDSKGEYVYVAGPRILA